MIRHVLLLVCIFLAIAVAARTFVASVGGSRAPVRPGRDRFTYYLSGALWLITAVTFALPYREVSTGALALAIFAFTAHVLVANIAAGRHPPPEQSRP